MFKPIRMRYNKNNWKMIYDETNRTVIREMLIMYFLNL